MKAPASIQIEIDTARVSYLTYIALITFNILLMMAHMHISESSIFVTHKDIKLIFDLTREKSIGNWLASLHFTLISATLFLYAATERRVSLTRSSSFPIHALWSTLAIFFLYLAIDDAARIHERLGSFFGDTAEAKQLQEGHSLWSIINNYPSYTWQVLYAPLIACFGGSLLILALKTFKTKNDIVLIFFGYGIIFGSQCLDYLDGFDDQLNIIRQHWTLDYDTTLKLIRSFEECLEMVGLATVLWALMKNHAESFPKLTLHFHSKSEADKSN